MSVCMSVVSAGTSVVLIKYTGKYVKIYFNMKITFLRKFEFKKKKKMLFGLLVLPHSYRMTY